MIAAVTVWRETRMNTRTLKQHLFQTDRSQVLIVALFLSVAGLALLLTLAAPDASLMVLAGGSDWGG
jgi:hypothetical protein